MIHTLSQTTKQIIFLAVIIFGLLAYSFMNASWTPPSVTPPNNNTEAPINVGVDYQAKFGDLGAVRMRAGEYCNADGTKCMTIGNTNPISGDGGNEMVYLPAPVEIVPMHSGVGRKNTDISLKDRGYPDNIVRVFITGYGKGVPSVCHETNHDGERCSISSEAFLDYMIDLNSNSDYNIHHNISHITSSVLIRDGIFIPVTKTGILHLSQYVSRSGASVNAEIIGYECAGKCHPATTNSCEVKFSWWAINDHGNTGSVTKIIYGTTPMAVGINLARGGSALTGSVPYSEILGQYSWGGGTFYNGHHATFGFYEPIRYFGQTAAVYTHGNLFVGSLNMSPNSTVTVTAMGSLVNVTGDASVTATVESCTP